MATFAVTLYVFAVAIVVIVVWMLTQRRQRVALPGRLAPVIVAARRRAMIAVCFAIVIFVAAGVAGVTLPALLGIPLAVAPLVSAAAGLLLYAATPPLDVAIGSAQLRTAGLSRRSWKSAIPPRWLSGAIEVTALFIAVIIFCGVTAMRDDLGLQRAIGFEYAEVSSMASPYPGWFYGIPALIALVVLIAATGIALHRIGTTTAFPHPDDADADSQWRRASASVVLGLATGAVLFALGGFALMAGQSMGNAAIDDVTPVVWSVIADTLQIGGGLFLILSIVSITLAAVTTFTIGDRLPRAMEQVR